MPVCICYCCRTFGDFFYQKIALELRRGFNLKAEDPYELILDLTKFTLVKIGFPQVSIFAVTHFSLPLVKYCSHW